MEEKNNFTTKYTTDGGWFLSEEASCLYTCTINFGRDPNGNLLLITLIGTISVKIPSCVFIYSIFSIGFLVTLHIRNI